MGGSATASASPLGGLRIELSLPTAAPAPDEPTTRSGRAAVAPSR
jgi:hypothetical protein